ncbi:monooxygenase-like protein [Trichoderma evansii]
MENLESTEIAIVGAGPAGLTLALSLAKFRIRSVILEKEQEITKDPRGVYLTGDAVRILHTLGLGDQLPYIGHERVLRSQVQKSPWCILRTGCTVTSRLLDDPPTIEYADQDDKTHRLTCQWLIGADGKVGVVRKHFLEPSAGIKQEDGTYPYDGTWVAANLRMSLPTRESHPNFPLWSLGYKPNDVYDLFWPKGWHFCSPPGKATAAGRFGPHEERLWRHEFRQDDIDDTTKVEELLWEHITPMITRDRDNQGRKLSTPVTYPRDCITVLRCRPFRFTQRVVNRWFDKRTILVGDAAHVFPPFAGQGIASGLRDAHQLAWRLSLLVTRGGCNTNDIASSHDILSSWALERRKSVDDAAFFSMLNGRLCNEETPLWVFLALKFQMFLDRSELLPRKLDPQNQKERKGFSDVGGGFFAKDYNGGGRMAQVYMCSILKRTLVLSDALLEMSPSAFTLVIVTASEDSQRFYDEAKSAVLNASIDASVLSEESIILVNPQVRTFKDCAVQGGPDNLEIFYPYVPDETVLQGYPSKYDACAYIDRLGRFTRFAVVRADLFIFSCANSALELIECLGLLRAKLKDTIE